MILFFDTETTGFVSNKPADHPSQPRIVQLAAQLCDEGVKPIAEFGFIVDPGIADGFKIPEKASAVHGITDEVAQKHGVPAELALSAFMHLYERADLLVAHRAQFDKRVMEIALSRHFKRLMTIEKRIFCTMEAATPVLNIPPTEKMQRAGQRNPKAPKLSECISHFFGEELQGAHNAMHDVAACRRVFMQLQTVGAA